MAELRAQCKNFAASGRNHETELLEVDTNSTTAMRIVGLLPAFDNTMLDLSGADVISGAQAFYDEGTKKLYS